MKQSKMPCSFGIVLFSSMILGCLSGYLLVRLKARAGPSNCTKKQGLPGAKGGHRISQKDHQQLQTKSKTRQHSPHPRCHRPLTPQLIKTCHKCHWPPTQSLAANPNTRKQPSIPLHTFIPTINHLPLSQGAPFGQVIAYEIEYHAETDS